MPALPTDNHPHRRLRGDTPAAPPRVVPVLDRPLSAMAGDRQTADRLEAAGWVFVGDVIQLPAADLLSAGLSPDELGRLRAAILAAGGLPRRDWYRPLPPAEVDAVCRVHVVDCGLPE